jgi:hypothetical protein
VTGTNDFASAAETDRTIAMMVADAQGGARTGRNGGAAPQPAASPRRRWWRRAGSAA